MESIISNIVLATLALSFVGMLYHYSSLKTRLKISIEEEVKLRHLSESLATEKIEYVRRIQELMDQINGLQVVIREQEKAQKEAFDAAKASLFDLGNGLSKQLIELHKQETKEAKEASDQNIKATSEKFHTEFERLVSTISVLAKEVDNSKSTVDVIKKSLLSPSGAGKLAEITLENILKSSGLRQNLDFSLQHNLDGKLRPDAVIFLPGSNLMVIDAKASKFLFEMSDADTEDTRDAATLSLMKTMNIHLKSLVSKEYAEGMMNAHQTKNKTFNNVITLMFLPTESALEQIANIDKDFIQKAWSYNIFPVGPAGLMNMLSFAKFQINDHMRNENHKLIIEEVRKLIGAVQVLTQHSQKLGNNIQSLANNYDKFSASFNRNFLPKARNIQSLGVDIGKEAIRPLERYHVITAQVETEEAEGEE